MNARHPAPSIASPPDDRAAAVLARRVVLTELVEDDRRQAIVARNADPRRVLVSGRFLSERYASGLCVEAGHSEEMTDAQIVATAPPGLFLTVVLNGEVHFGFDGEAYVLRSPRNSEPGGHRAMAVNLRRQATFRRRVRRGERGLSKVHIRVRSEWFARGDSATLQRLNARLLGHHLAKAYWQPSSQALALCERILALRDEPDALLRSLRAETLATQVLCQFIEDLLQEAPAPADACPPAPRKEEPLAIAMAFLETHLHCDLRLEEVARAAAMSVSALQRRFKRETGITVFDYVRQRRLEKVRDALRQDNLSISEAAYMAGYNHTSNFITAFKRRFGMTPGDMIDNDSHSL
ncbi:helix-turn-helix transcriptional regulator [Halomonas koreensis]|uniref:Helix-turn-helix transcriptional regulator n=1 Tax=Halomonas koreensis TaxID=245385 RepID=A0ABU1G185_9GAMM|nr:helix-turn-helix transcriptional regulator [Halomonas koreensis]MDR5866713.1 helix-turn-helix transcriptional regulator [Halomonas koreensis]